MRTMPTRNRDSRTTTDREPHAGSRIPELDSADAAFGSAVQWSGPDETKLFISDPPRQNPVVPTPFPAEEPCCR